jgi:hypothetical protein
MSENKMVASISSRSASADGEASQVGDLRRRREGHGRSPHRIVGRSGCHRPERRFEHLLIARMVFDDARASP